MSFRDILGKLFNHDLFNWHYQHCVLRLSVGHSRCTFELWNPPGLALLVALLPRLLPDRPREIDLDRDLERGVIDLERTRTGVRERLRERGVTDLPRRPPGER
jgi:hypothetical protein